MALTAKGNVFLPKLCLMSSQVREWELIFHVWARKLLLTIVFITVSLNMPISRLIIYFLRLTVIPTKVA